MENQEKVTAYLSWVNPNSGKSALMYPLGSYFKTTDKAGKEDPTVAANGLPLASEYNLRVALHLLRCGASYVACFGFDLVIFES